MPKYSWNLLNGLYRIDFLNLLLCMAVGHIVIGNPFFGATVYLFADIIKASRPTICATSRSCAMQAGSTISPTW